MFFGTKLCVVSVSPEIITPKLNFDDIFGVGILKLFAKPCYFAFS